MVESGHVIDLGWGVLNNLRFATFNESSSVTNAKLSIDYQVKVFCSRIDVLQPFIDQHNAVFTDSKTFLLGLVDISRCPFIQLDNTRCLLGRVDQNCSPVQVDFLTVHWNKQFETMHLSSIKNVTVVRVRDWCTWSTDNNWETTMYMHALSLQHTYLRLGDFVASLMSYTLYFRRCS